MLEKVVLSLDSVWVLLCAILVIFMQAGFALLEAGSTRMKNAGHVAGKQILGFSLAALAFWAFGYGLTFGEGNPWVGTTGWFLDLPAETGEIPLEISYLFQLSFAAVSLAIAWGASYGYPEQLPAAHTGQVDVKEGGYLPLVVRLLSWDPIGVHGGTDPGDRRPPGLVGGEDGVGSLCAGGFSQDAVSHPQRRRSGRSSRSRKVTPGGEERS
ncbi:ammonium transporter family [Melghirimyces profundicolus]|uniref:Ammonium transporter family n=1 Tax=Melghirimyces profundicolus TaxID=1242148 RepID=A0A2T6BG67_9BACL|nr:ammonium transporter family [Melghirimyces profundicolus]